jgi:YwiC-like protein
MQPTAAAPSKEVNRRVKFLPREHGATAMLLMPIVSVAILAREWRWAELATLAAAFAALAAKDPLVVVARQRFVWKQRHPETADAARWLAGWMSLLVISGLVLMATWPFKALVAMGLGAGAFLGLTILVNVKNWQRSTLFQIASAAALTSSALATCLSATGAIAPWCWWFWLFTMMQATAAILVVHARLDARIAMRGTVVADDRFRRAALITLGVIASAAITAAVLKRGWIALALALAVAGYGYDLMRQKDASALQLPLKTVGQRALTLSSIFSGLLILGFW